MYTTYGKAVMDAKMTLVTQVYFSIESIPFSGVI